VPSSSQVTLLGRCSNHILSSGQLRLLRRVPCTYRKRRTVGRPFRNHRVLERHCSRTPQALLYCSHLSTIVNDTLLRRRSWWTIESTNLLDTFCPGRGKYFLSNLYMTHLSFWDRYLPWLGGAQMASWTPGVTCTLTAPACRRGDSPTYLQYNGIKGSSPSDFLQISTALILRRSSG